MPSLADHRWAELDRPVLLVPVGSCEQHGPHLPLGTDALIAEALAARAADADHVVAPTVSIGASGEHAGFAGTLSVGVDAMTTVLVELVRSADWAAGVVFVNGHGGNFAALTGAVERSHADGRRRTAAWSPTGRGLDELHPDGIAPDQHAGWVETAVMLQLHPELVHLDAAAVGPQPDLSELRARGVRPLSPSGVLGDPATATADLGARILSRWAHDLVAFRDRLEWAAR